MSDYIDRIKAEIVLTDAMIEEIKMALEAKCLTRETLQKALSEEILDEVPKMADNDKACNSEHVEEATLMGIPVGRMHHCERAEHNPEQFHRCACGKKW